MYNYQTDMKKGHKGTIYIIVAAIMWSSTSIFVRKLIPLGISSVQIASIRLVLSAVIYCCLEAKTKGKTTKRNLIGILAVGICLGGMTITYYESIHLLPISTAEVLLYSSPVWSELYYTFKRKRVDLKEVLLVCLVMAGCILVVYQRETALSMKGVLIGSLSGLFYATYTILSKEIVCNNDLKKTNSFSFTIAAITVFSLAKPKQLFPVIAANSTNFEMYACFFGLAVISTVIPFLLFKKGLDGVNGVVASSLTTIEPIAATLFAAYLFQEKLTIKVIAGLSIIVLCLYALCKVDGEQVM